MKLFITILLASISLLFANSQTFACDLNPTAIIDLSPDDTVFLEGQFILFMSGNSSANCGYISEYHWQVDGVTLANSMITGRTFSIQSGQDSKTVDIQLRVQNSVGNYGYKTVTITIVSEHSSYYYLTDHLGSVRVTVDDDGNSVGWDDYYPFGLQMPGRTQNASNSNDDAKFTGYLLEQDGDLGLYHAEARMYDQVIGRFMQVDPLANQFRGWTPYHYTHNNPINMIDPTGMAACDDGDFCEWWNNFMTKVGRILDASKNVNFNLNFGGEEESGREYSNEEQMIADAVLQDLDNHGEKMEGIYEAMGEIPGGDVAQELYEGNYGQAVIDAATFIPIGRAGNILGKSTNFINITKGNSITNFKIGTDLNSFMNQLSNAVGKTWFNSKDGVVKILERGNIKYVARPAKGKKDPTVEIFKNDKLIQKYRLDK